MKIQRRKTSIWPPSYLNIHIDGRVNKCDIDSFIAFVVHLIVFYLQRHVCGIEGKQLETDWIRGLEFPLETEN